METVLFASKGKLLISPLPATSYLTDSFHHLSLFLAPTTRGFVVGPFSSVARNEKANSTLYWKLWQKEWTSQISHFSLVAVDNCVHICTSYTFAQCIFFFQLYGDCNKISLMSIYCAIQQPTKPFRSNRIKILLNKTKLS